LASLSGWSKPLAFRRRKVIFPMWLSILNCESQI
jgi:hypothetical protein